MNIKKHPLRWVLILASLLAYPIVNATAQFTDEQRIQKDLDAIASDRAARSPASSFLLSRPTTPAPGEFRLPLRQVMGEKELLVLRNASGIYTLFVPLSARMNLKTCYLHLEWTSSLALLPRRSVLRVVLNDVIIAQYALDPAHASNIADIPIPLSLMKDGFNRLQFIAAQHYTYNCEDPAAPELFTEINPDRSYFSATGDLKAITPRLSFLRWWIDEKLWFPYDFNICIPDMIQPNDLHLAWGSMATQGVALALKYNPFRVHTASALRLGMDNIVIGSMTELSAFLTATEIGSINGSFIAIKPLPNDPAHCMIILSGRNEQEVGQTILAFSLINFPLPDSQYAILDQFTLPQTPAYIRNAPLDMPGIYDFSQLSFETRTKRGWNEDSFDLEVYMPGDISKLDRSNVELRLHFAYGANARKDSVFNVFVNDEFQTAFRLSNIDGASFTGYRLYLPMQSFQPGRNIVRMTPVMVPLISRECEIIQDLNLNFTLYQDSEFVFPRILHQARLPDLGLFSQTAYPLSAPPDGTETAVYVAGHDTDSITASWTLLGKMSQISGALLHRLEISFKPPRSKKSLLVVGPRDQIPDDIFAKSPISPLQVGRMRYIMSSSPKPQKFTTSGVEEFFQKLRGSSNAPAKPEAPTTANIGVTAELVDDAVALQFESPYHPGYPITVFTAADGSKLQQGINRLQDRRFWDHLSGDLAAWSESPTTLATAKVGPDFIFKSSSVVTKVATRVDRYPWAFAIALVVILLLLGVGARFVLRGREQKENHKDTSEK